MSKIYHSREDRISDLHTDEERVQYDGKDNVRITEVATILIEHSANLIGALGNYVKEVDSEADEDSESRMGYARREVIENWAMAQAAISKVAWVLRVDGNVAFERLVNALKTDAAVDMRGL